MFVYGAPQEVPRGADRAAMERARETLQQTLVDLTERAERLAGGGPADIAADAAR